MTSGLTLDHLDMAILKLLQADARLSNKEIGERVHLTGQAVGARVRKLEEAGVIEGYTIRLNASRVGPAVRAFVTVFLSSGAAHQKFQAYAASQESIAEVHRVSGEGCYWMAVTVDDSRQLSELLDGLLPFANYKVSMSIDRIK
ncbi:Lrp/AsnC family transcriptional regulator [Paenibacillus hodogayensis]|uniref:Lrp/AsnC family transcriptional regulator n=1 Tax=Paenibacillus hodogayensis TaxID=279208 RepID=A0ABV5W6S7_9BACL